MENKKLIKMGAYPSTHIGVFLEVPIEQKEVPYTVKVNSDGKEFKKEFKDNS